MSLIHPTAVIHPSAKVASDVSVAPYAVIDGGVELGSGCVVGPHVHLTGQTIIGSGNRFHSGCVIGDAPQDLKYKGDPTGLRIGDNNTFREHTTIHRSAKLGLETVIGSDNYFMACAHVGHNSTLGNGNILANGCMLGGYVAMADKAFISGTCLIHQFTRVGALAMMQGGSAISKDLAPFTVARGPNQICGLNIVGLRRAGFSPAVRLELKRLYFLLFRSGHRTREATKIARERFQSAPAIEMIQFVESSVRGVCPDIRSGKNSSEDALETGA